MSPLSSLLNRGNETDVDPDVGGLPQRHDQVAVRVNLLPPEIAEAEQFRRGQVVRGAAVVAAVGAVGGLFLLASQSVGSAQNEVDAAQGRASALQQQVAALSAVPQTIAAVQAAETRLGGAMGNEVQWSHYLNALGMTTPSGVAFRELSVNQDVDAVTATAAAPTTPADPAAAAAAAAAAPTSTITSPLGKPGIATVTFSGTARQNNSIAVFLNRLAANDGNVDPYFTQASTEEDDASGQEVVNFEASVTVDETAKSGRYLKAGS